MGSHLDYEINKELGECYLFMGELDKAESYYLKAAGSNGVHPDPYLGLATIAVQRGDLHQAMNLYEKADSIASTDKSLAGIGMISMQQGELDRAFEKYLKALDLKPTNLIALFGLVQTAHQLERTGEALAPLERYLEIEPAKSEVRFTLSGCLVASGRKEDARRHLEMILAEDPTNAQAMELMAQL